MIRSAGAADVEQTRRLELCFSALLCLEKVVEPSLGLAAYLGANVEQHCGRLTRQRDLFPEQQFRVGAARIGTERRNEDAVELQPLGLVQRHHLQAAAVGAR